MKQEMTGWQWHQLDHIQSICTSLQTDNHASTSSLIFYRPDALPGAQPTASSGTSAGRMKGNWLAQVHMKNIQQRRVLVVLLSFHKAD